jgi:hypothetical protein
MCVKQTTSVRLVTTTAAVTTTPPPPTTTRTTTTYLLPSNKLLAARMKISLTLSLTEDNFFSAYFRLKTGGNTNEKERK